jgi:hypothetical protein
MNYEDMAKNDSRIVVIGSDKSPLTVVDGVHRITGLFLYYFIRNQGKFDVLEAYHGVAQKTYDRCFM